MSRPRRARRIWSDAEKRKIVAQTFAPGVSVAEVARRYALNTNQVFKWSRDERYAPGTIDLQPDAAPVFLPIEVADADEPEEALSAGCEAATSARRLEIVLPGGGRLNVSGAFDPDAVARLARSLGA